MNLYCLHCKQLLEINEPHTAAAGVMRHYTSEHADALQAADGEAWLLRTSAALDQEPVRCFTCSTANPSARWRGPSGPRRPKGGAMTVAELIKKLRKCPATADVLFAVPAIRVRPIPGFQIPHVEMGDAALPIEQISTQRVTRDISIVILTDSKHI
jgi:hypothetical protein